MTSFKKFFKNKRVLITGHTGFIGSWLTKWLQMLDSEICGYALGVPTTPNLFSLLNLEDRMVDTRGDIRDKISLSKCIEQFQPEIVFHLAAQPIVLDSFDNPVETFEINVNGTINLLESLRHVDSVKEILVMTSDKVYVNDLTTTAHIESDCIGGKDPYSASKACQDIVARSFWETYFSQSRIRLATIRAGNVIGGGDWSKKRIIPDVVNGITQKSVIKLRNFDSVRPWQYVLDAINGMLKLTNEMWNNNDLSGSWNIGPDKSQEKTVGELVEKFFSNWGAGEYAIEKSSVNIESPYLNLDAKKAHKELQWKPLYSFDSVVEATASWYRKYYEGDNMENATRNEILNFMNKM